MVQIVSGHRNSLPDSVCSEDLLYLGHRFGSTALDAAVRGVQNLLVLPAFFAGHGKLRLAFDRRRERICLQRIGEAIRDRLRFDRRSPTPQFEDHRLLDIQAIVGAQRAGVADEFDRAAIVGDKRAKHCAQSAAGKFERQCRCDFDLAHLAMGNGTRRDSNDFILQDVTCLLYTSKKLHTFPGIIFNYTQPAEDAVDEALTGLKSSLAVKIYGDDLDVLQDKAIQIKNVLSQVPGFTDLTVVRELGQPSLLIDVDRDKIARYGVNVADVEAVIQAAVGGQAVTQVIQGEKLFDLVVRMQPQFRSSAHEIGNLLVGTPDGQQIPLSQLANIQQGNGASFIYRENNSRYIGVQYSIEGRDLERAVQDGQAAVNKAIVLPQGYRLEWGGEYSQFLEAKAQLSFIGPLAIVLIFMILFALYGNFKFPVTIALGVIMTEPVGALIALKLTHTPFSVSSVLGLLALLGVSVETAVILVSYINKLRQEGNDIRTSTREASLLRLRPIMMTALVACLGLLPAALSTGIGSDTQRPFAIVIVAGLVSRLFIGFFVNPVLYELVARDGDVLQV